MGDPKHLRLAGSRVWPKLKVYLVIWLIIGTLCFGTLSKALRKLSSLLWSITGSYRARNLTMAYDWNHQSAADIAAQRFRDLRRRFGEARARTRRKLRVSLRNIIFGGFMLSWLTFGATMVIQRF